jgi:hypothetical protein
MKPTQILDHLVEKRIQNNILNTLTIDIIKNIRRNLINGKRVIYEEELDHQDKIYFDNLLKMFASNIMKNN